MPNRDVVEKKEREVLVFNLSNEEMGLDISCVREVLKAQKIHPLPKAPGFIEGVINLRGHIIVVIDLRRKFNFPAANDRPNTRIIICSVNKFIVGLMVDGVSGVLSLPEENIEPPPRVISMQIENSYIKGIARFGEKVIVLFNLEQIFTKAEINGLSKMK